MTTINFNEWERVTGALDWGVQRTLYDTLCLVADEKVKMVHGRDSIQAKGSTYPCLINAVAAMIAEDVTQVSPAGRFPGLVHEFDSLNGKFVEARINKGDGFLSPLAAEILVRHFAPLKEKPADAPEPPPVTAERCYIEPTDEQMAADLNRMMDTPAPDANDGLDHSLDEQFARIREIERDLHDS